MTIPVTTTITRDVDLSMVLRGTFQPGCPEQGPTYASGGQPAEPDCVEDVEIVSVTAEKLVPAPLAERGSHPNGVWETVDLLEGLEPAARAIVHGNLLRFFGQADLEAELLEAVPEADPDDDRD